MRRLLLWALLALPCAAHNGPPFAIIDNRVVGPCLISVWANPDIGTGTFFVFVDALPGKDIPSDIKFEIGLRPLSGRLPETRLATTRQNNHGQVEFDAATTFDRQEFWTVRLIETSARGNGEASTNVEVTPVGFGSWDILWFGIPFVAIGFLWIRVALRRRASRAR